MKLGAVVVVGSDNVSFGPVYSNNVLAAPPGLVSGSVATTDVLGRSVVDRVIGNLLEAGVSSVSLICHSRLASAGKPPSNDFISRTYFSDSTESFDLTEAKVADQIEQGASVVLLIRLDSYMEFEYGDVLEFHRDRGQVVTRVRDNEGPLDFWLIDADRAQNSSLSAASVLRGRSSSRLQYHLRGYSNRLCTPRDLRQLVKDSFESRCRLQPTGKQKKPGVWIDEGASVHRMARVVAPAYVGRNSQVEAGALVTRGSNIEAGCSVAGGTVVEDASILRNTYVGPGLEISQAVVERGRFMHLRRNVAVTIADPSLIGAIQPQSREMPFMFDAVVTPAGVRARNEGYRVPGQLSEAFGD